MPMTVDGKDWVKELDNLEVGDFMKIRNASFTSQDVRDALKAMGYRSKGWDPGNDFDVGHHGLIWIRRVQETKN